MGTIAIENKQANCEVVDLFDSEMAQYAAELRREEQRSRLMRRAEEVAEMLDRLDGKLSVDREQAVAMLAEYSGLLDLVVEDIRSIRDIDETFGAESRRMPKIARLALQLERGIAYLQGIFSVVSSGEVLPVYNWKLVHRDVQEVLGTSLELIRLPELVAERQAA
ncbi:hypothetical protein [Aeoliella mucimassa]|uniref:Uncharacterized protein n=1 Tax=Aeoliella mucimassa TaxID=2527972 RepID=A0A518AS30_9BACT|nr:hypothetical protein [Aeoliella mucimassa]QDU57525.1 hypothetical protein Pan181_37430 [Aeoliella mucimassa]